MELKSKSNEKLIRPYMDSPEKIQKCLSCEKKKCTNCLGTIIRKKKVKKDD